MFAIQECTTSIKRDISTKYASYTTNLSWRKQVLKLFSNLAARKNIFTKLTAFQESAMEFEGLHRLWKSPWPARKIKMLPTPQLKNTNSLFEQTSSELWWIPCKAEVTEGNVFNHELIFFTADARTHI